MSESLVASAAEESRVSSLVEKIDFATDAISWFFLDRRIKKVHRAEKLPEGINAPFGRVHISRGESYLHIKGVRVVNFSGGEEAFDLEASWDGESSTNIRATKTSYDAEGKSEAPQTYDSQLELLNTPANSLKRSDVREMITFTQVLLDLDLVAPKL